MSRARETSRQAGSIAVTLLSVLAIVVQCLLVQTHIDAANAPFAVERAASAGDDASASLRSGPVKRQPCALCEAMALTGVFVVTEAPALAPLERVAAKDAPLAGVVAATAMASHDWRSRAPPPSL